MSAETQIIGVHKSGFVHGFSTVEEAVDAVVLDGRKHGEIAALLYRLPLSPDQKPLMSEDMAPAIEGAEFIRVVRIDPVGAQSDVSGGQSGSGGLSPETGEDAPACDDGLLPAASPKRGVTIKSLFS